MAKHDEEVALFLTTAQSALTTAGILREAIKLPSRNGKLMFHLILLFVFPFSLLLLLHNVFARPLICKIEDSYEQSSLHLKDVAPLVGIELLLFLPFSIVSFCGMMLTIYASASTYIGKYVVLNDLITWIVKLSWKNPLITWAYVSFFPAICIILVVVVVKLVYAICSYYLISWAVGIAAAVFYLYLAAHWTLALVVSVMEDDCHGKNAVQRARKLIAGREVEGLLFMIILVAISCPIYIVLYVILADDDDEELGPFTQYCFGLITLMLFCISKLFTFGVFTIFWYECELSYGDKVEIELED